jgi:hypothetical protein
MATNETVRDLTDTELAILREQAAVVEATEKQYRVERARLDKLIALLTGGDQSLGVNLARGRLERVPPKDENGT